MAVARVMLALLLGACSAGPPPESDGLAGYTVVFLKAGPNPEVAPGELQLVLEQQRELLQRLAAAGHLLVWGPLMPPRADADNQSLLVFATEDLAAARAMVESDPAVRAGVFRYEVFPWLGPAALRRVPEAQQRLQLELPPDAGPTARLQEYMVVTCADPVRAERLVAPLRARGLVPFFGRLGGELEGHALFLLAVADPHAARQLLPDASAGAPEWTLHPWLATRALLSLAHT